MAAEFASATLEYAIVFAGTEAVIPVAVLGVRTDENLYITQQGGWHAPSTSRRSSVAIHLSLQAVTRARRLCCASTRRSRVSIRAAAASCSAKMGKPTPYVENVLKFLQQYQLEFHRTQEFCKKLKDLNLLRPMQAQVDIGAGERLALGGFSVVDRARLKTCRPLCLRS
jgi:hypothetical protein